MTGIRARRSLIASLAVLLVVCGHSAQTVAQTTQDQNKSIQDKMQVLQDRIDEMNRELQAMKEQQRQQSQAVVAATDTAKKAAATADKQQTALANITKGFFGTLDASVDYTTKGMNGLVAYPYGYATGAPGSPYVITGPSKAPPYGNVSWLGMMSSNGSNLGYRGTHHIDAWDLDLQYQISTAFDLVAAPGLQNTWTKQSNTVLGAIGLGDTYIGFAKKNWGRVRFGEMYMPYKTSTDRLNPFSGQLGNYSTVMGNTGGDNRVEFGTRMDHVVSYQSPTFGGLNIEAAYGFGQQVDPNSNLTSLGSPDCSGGNVPGSGNLPLNCDDGGFDDAYSVAMKFERDGLYLTAAYEMHKRVNRSSDGDGSNNPYYGYIFGLGPNNPLSAQLLDWADYQAYAAEYPLPAAAGTPEFNTAVDVADEWAMKFGGQYSFPFGLTISYLYEDMHRDVPQSMEWQNERQRTGQWVAIEQDLFGGRDRFAVGWAHAGASVGDPGGQHNFNPNGIGDNQANMYTIAWWHQLDKQLTLYFDAAETVNDGNAHYDIGAGGHGIKTDCHDATHPQFIDYSSAGPTTWGGCHEIGISTGVNYRF